MYSFGQSQRGDVQLYRRRRCPVDYNGAMSKSKLLVLVDGSRYRQAVGDPRRWSERLEAWRQTVRDAGLELVAVNLRKGRYDLAPAPVPMARP